MLRALVCCLLLFAGVEARAACASPMEPPLSVLTARALKVAALEPERVRSMLRRARVAALLPHVQGHLGRGSYDYVRNPDTLEPTFTSTDSWRFDVTVTFSLDRLVFDPQELRVAEGAGRLVEHRARLLERVVGLWQARRELGAAVLPSDDRCVELSALLDTLTGGALGFSSDEPGPISLPLDEARP